MQCVLVYRDVEKPLNLGCVQVHSLSRICVSWETYITNIMLTHYDMVAPRLLQHICDELSGNRCPALVFLVLASVGEERDHCSNAFCACDFAGVDHNAKFHEGGVDLATSGVDDVHIVLSYRLCNTDVSFTDSAFRDFGTAEREAKPVEEGEAGLDWVLNGGSCDKYTVER